MLWRWWWWGGSWQEDGGGGGGVAAGRKSISNRSSKSSTSRNISKSSKGSRIGKRQQWAARVRRAASATRATLVPDAAARTHLVPVKHLRAQGCEREELHMDAPSAVPELGGERLDASRALWARQTLTLHSKRRPTGSHHQGAHPTCVHQGIRPKGDR